MPYILYTVFNPEHLSVPEANRLEHRLGRKLLVRGLADFFGLSADEDQIEEMLAIPDSGKPYLKDHRNICFNITHCTGLAACAFDTKDIGADAEMPGYFPEILIKRALSPAEKQLLAERGTSEDLRNKIAAKGTPCEYFPSFEEIESWLLSQCASGDLILTMGAGSIFKVGEDLLGK